MRTCLLLALCCTLSALSAAELTLARDGTAECVIITGADDGMSRVATMRHSTIHHTLPANLMREGAEDLARHLNELGGIWNPANQVTITDDPEARAQTRILLGSAAIQTHNLQEAAASLQYPAYIIRTIGNDLCIFGSSTKGTVNGIYGFLQDELGVRWFGPQELFRVVPEHEVLTIGELDKRVAPSFAGRRISFDTRIEHPAYRWGVRRMRAAEFYDMGEPFVNASHNLSRIFPARTYWEEHPEYYAIQSGQRRRADLHPHHAALCYTNTDVIRIATEAALRFFRANPRHHSFSLGIDDCAAICECDDCLAIQPERTFRNARVASDMYYHFVNEVARGVAEEFPDRYLGVIAYNDVTVPPLGPLEPNVHVVFVNDISEYFDADLRARDHQLIRDWQAKDITLGIYYYTGLAKLVPAYWPRLLAEELKAKHAQGFTNVRSESTPGWPWRGPMAYAEMRLLWDVDLDVDALVDEYMNTLFGPAADPMARLYALFEDIHRRPRPGGFLREHYKYAQFNPYTAEDLAEMRRLIATAHGAIKGLGLGYDGHQGKHGQRVAYVTSGLSLFLDMLQGKGLAAELAAEPRLDDLSAIQQLEMIQQLTAILERHEQVYRETILSDPTHSRRYLRDTCTPVREQWKQAASGTIAPALARLAAARATFATSVQARLDEQIDAFAADPFQRVAFAYRSGRLTPGANRIANPGFEQPGDDFDFPDNLDWMTSPAHMWNWWQRLPGLGTFDVTDQDVHSGQAAGRLQGVGDGAYITHVRGVTPGDMYHLQAYVKNTAEVTREDKPQVELQVRWLDAQGRWTDQGIRFGQATSELHRWVHLEAIAQIPPNAATAVVMLIVNSLQGSETIYIDDVAFRQLEETP